MWYFDRPVYLPAPSASLLHTGSLRHHSGLDSQVLAALSNEAGGWGDARPDWLDTCLDQDAPGPLTDLDAEWQVGVRLRFAVVHRLVLSVYARGSRVHAAVHVPAVQLAGRSHAQWLRRL